MDPSNFTWSQVKSCHLGFSPSLQPVVLRVGLPAVTKVPWDEIIDLRTDPGLKDFRRVVDDVSVEISTLSQDADFGCLPDEIRNRWNSEFVGAIEGLKPSNSTRI